MERLRVRGSRASGKGMRRQRVMEEDYSRVSKPLLAQITVYVSDIKRLAPEWPGSAFISQSSLCPLVTFYNNFPIKLTRPGSLFIWQLVGPFFRSAKNPQAFVPCGMRTINYFVFRHIALIARGLINTVCISHLILGAASWTSGVGPVTDQHAHS